MSFEFDEDFDKKLLTGSGIALASYAVAGAAAPAKLHEAYMMRVGNARPRHAAAAAAAAAAARQRLRFASLMLLTCSCPQTELCHEPTMRCELPCAAYCIGRVGRPWPR